MLQQTNANVQKDTRMGIYLFSAVVQLLVIVTYREALLLFYGRAFAIKIDTG